GGLPGRLISAIRAQESAVSGQGTRAGRSCCFAGRAVQWWWFPNLLRCAGRCLMASPFPGMDPYIEISHLWEDFHTHLIDEIYRALSEILPDRYVVRAGERRYLALVEAVEEE